MAEPIIRLQGTPRIDPPEPVKQSNASYYVFVVVLVCTGACGAFISYSVANTFLP